MTFATLIGLQQPSTDSWQRANLSLMRAEHPLPILKVADFFSCGGGTSAGFARRPGYAVIGAVDLELAKPSGGDGASDCNATFYANHGIAPMNRDMRTLEPDEFAEAVGIEPGELAAMISCAPCTHLSRAKPTNHLEDRPENTLVGRSGEFAVFLKPGTFFMENARELIMGNYRHHHSALVSTLEAADYDVRSEIHILTRFGLPQIRERALVVASRIGPARTLSDLWAGWGIKPEAITVRSALARLAEWQAIYPGDPDGNAFPGTGPLVTERLKATPADGGSWIDVARNAGTRNLLTADCKRRWKAGRLWLPPRRIWGEWRGGSPLTTIKRECAHVGNGRYAHPVENRLLTCPGNGNSPGGSRLIIAFPPGAVANRYRHIGDAVPPLIAYQMSALDSWMRTGRRPTPEEFIMPDTCLRVEDVGKGQLI